MMSSRLPANLEPNASLAPSLRSARRGTTVVDLTEPNPTRGGIQLPGGSAGSARGSGARSATTRSRSASWSARAAVAADFAAAAVVMSADRVALTSSTSEAYALLFKLLCDAGDAVLVPQPSYPLFEHLTLLESVDARFRTCWNTTARGASTSTRSLRPRPIARARS